MKVELNHSGFQHQFKMVGKRIRGNRNVSSVERRNERERCRIKHVNMAFDELREHVPTAQSSRRKISKVDTLQSAIEYIKVLEQLIKDREEKNNKEKQEIIEQTPPSGKCDTIVDDSGYCDDESTSSIHKSMLPPPLILNEVSVQDVETILTPPAAPLPSPIYPHAAHMSHTVFPISSTPLFNPPPFDFSQSSHSPMQNLSFNFH